MAEHYKHLGLTRWPFPIVPQREFCTFLADRHQLRSDVADLVETLARRDTSSIHLFWSWYGAGKTHTLFYLANQAAEITRQHNKNIIQTVYSEFPKAAHSFLDLYRSFIVGLDIDMLIDAFLEICTCSDSDRLHRELMIASPDLATALQVMTTGEKQNQVTALRWLRAETLPISEFRKVAISQKINSSEEATRILAALIAILTSAAQRRGRPACRVLWMLDEFQRIEKTSSRILDEINTGLHSTFNACPSGLSLFLSFSGRPDVKSLPVWFSRELRDRIGRTKVMILPPMLAEEALQFVRDVLVQLRDPEYKCPTPYFPFTEQSCRAIIEEVGKKEELKPRAMMHAFSAVLQEADAKMDAGEIETISPEFARRALGEYIALANNEEV